SPTRCPFSSQTRPTSFPARCSTSRVALEHDHSRKQVAGAPLKKDDLDTEYRERAREWLAANVPSDWRTTAARGSESDMLAWQRWWLSELDGAGYAVPHWSAA